MKFKLLVYIIILSHAAHSKNDFLYTNFEYTNNINEHEINGSFRLQYMGFLPHLFLINYKWIPEDPYNEQKFNYSMLASINGSVMVIYGIVGMLSKRSSSKTYGRVFPYVIAPFYLLNSQSHFPIIHDRKYQNMFSFYLNSRTDFYSSKERLWFRYSPGFGLEFSHSLNNSYGLSYNIGLTKAVDLIGNKKEWQPFQFSIGIKITEYAF